MKKKIVVIVFALLVACTVVQALSIYDVNGDDDVDVFDLSDAWTHRDAYDARYDMNGDGEIDLDDLVIIWENRNGE